MNILALDLSFTFVGWAARSDGVIECGKQSFQPWPVRVHTTRAVSSPALRFHWFRLWLCDMIELQQPERVIFERPHLQGWHATNALVGLSTRVEEECALRGLNCQSVHTGTLKKYATGNGNATKAQMQAAAKARFSFYHPEEDEGGDIADALMLLSYAIECA